MELFADKREKGPSITQRQFWVMLLAAAFLLVLLSVVFVLERNKERQLRVEQTSHRLALAEEIVAREVNRVQADLNFVAALPEVKRATEGNQQSLQDVAEVFKNFVSSQKTYSQIRLVSRHGIEIARVDWDGKTATITQEEELQDKSDRYYVTDSLDLKSGQIFTSEFDLNLENGQIERPLKPVIRFVTPVSRGGEVENLLVFNYQGSSLLKELAAISLPGNTYLIKEDGGFLLGPNPSSEWGWLLEHQTRLSTLFTDVSANELINATGPVKSGAGLFHTKEIQFGRGDTQSNERQSSLFCVAHIDNSKALESSRKLLFRLLIVGGIMLIPLALITRFWAAAIDRRESQNRRIAESERRLRQLSAQLVGLQEEERRNLSREIHDSLGQQATAINLDLRMLKGKIADSPELERLIEESDQLLKSLHGFATRVRPAELDDLGLKVALESHVSEFVSRTGIETQLLVHVEDSEIDASVAAHIFRIVQESLNNIAKHSGATVAAVKLSLDPNTNELQLGISDDGVGMQNDPAEGGGYTVQKRLGILGVRERVDLLNGTIAFNTSEGQGTKLDVVIPISLGAIEQTSVKVTG